MPSKIKVAITLLILSLISTVLGVYFDGLYMLEPDSLDMSMIWLDLIWAAVIGWLIFDLCRRKNINLTIILVSLVVFGFAMYDLYIFGFGLPQFFYILELVLLLSVLGLLYTRDARGWIVEEEL